MFALKVNRKAVIQGAGGWRINDAILSFILWELHWTYALTLT